MRIKNLKIDSFGKIEDVSISLDDRITVISGKNEAGKSSIATFTKYMLYGFDSSKKSDVSENQKKKYMPWNGLDCSGEMTFVSDEGKEYTAVRKTSSRSQNTIFDENGMPYTSDNAGDVFFGINENAYKKTAFIGQREASFTDEGELDGAIRNMVYSADESVDSKKALKKLEDIRKYYLGKAGRSGELYEIEKELEALETEREKWKDGHKELLSSEYQLSETKKKIAFNKEKKALLEREKENLECFEAKKKLLQIENARKLVEEDKSVFEEHYKTMQNGMFAPDSEYLDSIKNAQKSINDGKERVNDAVSSYSRAKENLDSLYGEEGHRQVFEILENEGTDASFLAQRISALKKEKGKKTLAVILMLLIVTIPIALVILSKASKAEKQLCEIAGKYGCENADVLEKILASGESYKAVSESAKRMLDSAGKALEESKEALSVHINELSALSEMGGFDVSMTDEYLNKASLWLDKCSALKAKCREDFVAYNTLCDSVDMNELSEKAKNFDDSVEIRDMKVVLQQLNFYSQANEALIVKERELEKTAAVLSGTLPKPAEIQSRILSLGEKRNEMAEKHASLVLAIEALEKASENMRSEAAPKIAAETSELFARITDGKYRGLYADNEMKLTFLEKNEAQVRDAGYLSAGTLDAAYISLRIALCEFLYKEHPTLVFDDAFCNMDDERLKNMLDFLLEISEDFQIVILSCHDREKEYLKGKAKLIDFVIE